MSATTLEQDPLAGLTHEQYQTYRSLISDETPWTMNDVARGMDVQPQTVRSWRKDSLRAKDLSSPHPNLLPIPDIPIEGKPTWRAGTIRRWAIQTGRMTPAGEPQRLKPPGRPRAA
jgi:hypothetical protein